MTPETAVQILGEARSIESQIAAQEEKIDALKDRLKEEKDLRDTLVAELRAKVHNNMPLLDGTGA